MSRVPIRSSFPNPLGDSSRESRKPLVNLDDFIIFLMTLPGSLAVLISLFLSNFGEVPAPSENRQIILDVPKTSQVDAQVTSGNNTVNLKNL